MKYHLHALQLFQLFWLKWKCLGISYKAKNVIFENHTDYLEMFELIGVIFRLRAVVGSLISSYFLWIVLCFCRLVKVDQATIKFGTPYEAGKQGQVAGDTNWDVLLTKTFCCLQIYGM